MEQLYEFADEVAWPDALLDSRIEELADLLEIPHNEDRAKQLGREALHIVFEKEQR